MSREQQNVGTGASDFLLNEAVAHHQAGRLAEAEEIYRRILVGNPNHPEALCLLGTLAYMVGENEAALELLTQSIAADPNYADALNNKGACLKSLGRHEEAVVCIKKSIDIRPDYAEAHYNLANTLRAQRHMNEALASFRDAIRIKPDYADAHNNLGDALRDLGKLDEAEESLTQALAINPDFALAHNNLGSTLRKMGKLDQAETSIRKALALAPDMAPAHSNLGNVLNDLGTLEESVASYQKALAIEPQSAEVHCNLGSVLKGMGRTDEAVESYQEALTINPEYAEAYSNLGGALNELGRPDEAVENYQKALSIKPEYASAHSDKLLIEQYRLGHSAETLFKLHCDWDDRHGRAFRSAWPAHENTHEAERRLKVGFVSPDLGRHPVGYFVVPLLENLGGQDIETVCYSDRIEDDMTGRIQAAADGWRNTYGVSDEDLTKAVLCDGIDILIDLSGHSAGNRLAVFARKPAPLQVAWAGYVGTTGLSAMDYLVSDRYSTPKGEESFYSEKIIRMPDGWLCYEPPDYAPEVGPLPAKRSGAITFGSFSNPAKLNTDVVSLWAKILGLVKNARLLIKSSGVDTPANTNRLTALFEAQGVDRSRLILEGKSPHNELLARYHDVDIALDPFPYSGGLTTYEALWMGVPVITVPGQTFASRHSLSHLTTCGLPELVARDDDDYVALAIGLANDPRRLEDLRAELREKMSRSPICDGKKFAEGFAGLMRDIWRQWCSPLVDNP